MRLKSSKMPVFAGVLAVVASGAAYAQQTVVAKHVPAIVQSGRAQYVAPMATSETLHLTLALPLRNQDQLDALLAESDVVSLHLLLTEETRGFLSAERLARMKPGAILVNTARGAVVDEAALMAALEAGRLLHAGLDVYDVEPMPAGHPWTRVENATLSAHSAFRTPEASDNLIEAALDHCRRIAA